MSKKYKKNKGYTLIEIMIALGIIIILGVGVFYLYSKTKESANIVELKQTIAEIGNAVTTSKLKPNEMYTLDYFKTLNEGSELSEGEMLKIKAVDGNFFRMGAGGSGDDLTYSVLYDDKNFTVQRCVALVQGAYNFFDYIDVNGYTFKDTEGNMPTVITDNNANQILTQCNKSIEEVKKQSEEYGFDFPSEVNFTYKTYERAYYE